MTQPNESEDVDSDLEDLLIFIRDARGFDFTGYKRSSLARRIRKRMQEAGGLTTSTTGTGWRATPKNSGICSTPS